MSPLEISSSKEIARGNKKKQAGARWRDTTEITSARDLAIARYLLLWRAAARGFLLSVRVS